MKKILLLLLSLAMLLSLASCGDGGKMPDPAAQDGWYASWGTAAQRAGNDEIPTTVRLKENTCRQIITPTLSGDKLRLTISNEMGSIPLIIEKMHIADSNGLGSSGINTNTDTAVTFNGEESFTIEIGETVTTDEISFDVKAFSPIAVTTKFGKYIGGDITCHITANTTCWIAEGDHVSDISMPAGQTMGCWYYITGMDVWAEAGTDVIVCLGDSITDGVGASMDKNASWPDKLSELFKGDEKGVINMGISGNILSGDWGVKSRLERDVLNVAGAKYCLLMIGINDIGGSSEDITGKLIADYKEIVTRCHEKGIMVYACTMTPIKGSGYYSADHEAIRAACNEFLMSDKGGFDGFVDFSSAIARDDDPEQMKDEYNCPWGDFLHPGDMGYEVMAKLAHDKFLEFNKE